MKTCQHKIMSTKASTINICRICLTLDDTKRFSSIFLKFEIGSHNCEINKMVEYCTHLKILPSDNLPKLICQTCINEISNFYIFREKCLKNDLILRERYENFTVKNECDNLDIKHEIQLSSTAIFHLPEETDYELGNNPVQQSDSEISSDENFIKIEFDTPNRECEENEIKNENLLLNSEVIFKCDVCYETFDSRGNLREHKKQNHIHEINAELYTVIKRDNKTHYSCAVCKHFCRHKDALRVHLRKHTGERPFRCEVCSKQFVQKKDVVKHMKSHNPGEPILGNFRCKYCSLNFNQAHLLTKHIKLCHPTIFNQPLMCEEESKNYEKLCDICGKVLLDVRRLQDHLRTHTGEKIYKCAICGKMLASQSSLSQHMQRHEPEKKFQCDTCGNNYKTRYSLTLHKKTHAERKHVCYICNKRFMYNYILKFHIRTHTGEKPYSQDQTTPKALLRREKKNERRRKQRQEEKHKRTKKENQIN